ncbi:MAG: phosphoribosylglycinamide formyltransferase [Tepidisphaeraceae bacterium]
MRLAVLVSGGGTTLQNLIDRIGAGTLNASIEIVIGSKPGLVGLDRAKAANIQSEVVVRKDFNDLAEFSRKIFSLCESHGVDLVCLGGWLQLIEVPDAWLGRVINIHPSLLPKFGGKGMYGRHVHAAVLAANETVSGCTVHFVDNEFDAGPVILQKQCQAKPTDTPETLAARVFEQECDAFPEAITAYAQGRVRLENGRAVWR